MKKFLLPIFLCVMLIGTVYWKYQHDIKLAWRNYLIQVDVDKLVTKESMEDSLLSYYQHLNIISHFPGITNLEHGLYERTEDARHISEINQSLMTDGAYTGIFIFTQQKDNTRKTGINGLFLGEYLADDLPELSSKTINKYSISFNLAPGTKGGLNSIINNQFDWFRDNYPNKESINNPSQPPLLTDIISNGTFDQFGKDDTSRLLFSIPIYKHSGALFAIAAIILEKDVLREMLFPTNSVILNSYHGYTIFPYDDGPWETSKKWLIQLEPNPTLLYSKVLKIALPDMRGEWLFWSGEHDDVFLIQPAVISAREFVVIGIIASIILSSLLSLLISLMERQRRTAIEKHRELEEQVSQRTEELNSAMKKAKQSAEHAYLNEQKFRTVFNTAVDGIITADETSHIEIINPAARKIFGFSISGRIDTNLNNLMSYSEAARISDLINSTDTDHFHTDQAIGRRHDGSEFPLDLSIALMLIEKKNHYVCIIRDITDRKRAEEEIRQLAHFDMITKLPNRNYLYDHLTHIFANADRYKNPFAVMFVDLDGFKKINDTLGHEQGDQLLKVVGKRFSNCIREADIAGRFGGDEFLLILTSIKSRDDAAQAAERILEAVNQPIMLKDSEQYVGCSIGISIYPDDGHDVTSMITNADIAMYLAKSSGKNTYRFYSKKTTNGNELTRATA